MNIVLWPFELRLLIVLLLGIASARFINWAIYTWAFYPRKLGPWSPPPSVAERSSKSKRSKQPSERTWADHLPVWGWWRLRRESEHHGIGYWIRPMLLELFYPLVLAWYFKFQISAHGLPPGAARLVLPFELHIQFLGHWVLLTLMVIATFIDFDEQSIPDYVTIPGTVLGIVGSAIAPLWLPLNVGLAGGIAELDFAWPGTMPPWSMGTTGLVISLGILAIWAFALLDRRIITRRGTAKAIQYFFARLFRHKPLWITVFAVASGLMIFVSVCWNAGIPRWSYLFSSLMGLAFAGGMTWAVRIAARIGLGIEALGFGDVTLMAMIGSYIGLQPCLVVFFLAPFVAMAFVLLRWLITRDTATPYGPYLCGSVLVLIVFWDQLWTNRFSNLFIMADNMASMLDPNGQWPWMNGTIVVIGGVLVCVFLIGAMLWNWLLIKLLIFKLVRKAESN